MQNIWSKQAYVQGFYLKTVTLKNCKYLFNWTLLLYIMIKYCGWWGYNPEQRPNISYTPSLHNN